MKVTEIICDYMKTHPGETLEQTLFSILTPEEQSQILALFGDKNKIRIPTPRLFRRFFDDVYVIQRDMHVEITSTFEKHDGSYSLNVLEDKLRLRQESRLKEVGIDRVYSQSEYTPNEEEWFFKIAPMEAIRLPFNPLSGYCRASKSVFSSWDDMQNAVNSIAVDPIMIEEMGVWPVPVRQETAEAAWSVSDFRINGEYWRHVE